MNVATPPELHLPGLEDVHVALGGAGSRPARSWAGRVRDALATYLPLLLMALVAAATAWLVKHTPRPAEDAPPRAARPGADYTMDRFSITRFDSQGRYRVRLEGDVLRHFPDTDRIEIDGLRLHALGPDGRVTRATARRALANGDASEVQLFGGAQVRSELPGAAPLEVEGEFLHAFLQRELLKSHLPVTVRSGSSVARAGGIEYDHLSRQLKLAGPVRSTLYPPGRTPPGAKP